MPFIPTDPQPRISIIIPTYQEADNLRALLPFLRTHGGAHLAEIIVSDGGSTDQTLAVAQAAGAVALVSPRRGRGAQLNFGARHARGQLLYFVHADARPPASFATDLYEALAAGYPMGCYRFRFASSRWLLRVNAYFTRFDRLMCRGGDQTLFVTRPLFDHLGGYRDDFLIMEDYDIIVRARRQVPFRIIPENVVVSARKYETNSYLRVNLANLTIFLMYFRGCSQQQMAQTYKKLLNHR